jgi:hypothetical protein
LRSCEPSPIRMAAPTLLDGIDLVVPHPANKTLIIRSIG